MGTDFGRLGVGVPGPLVNRFQDPLGDIDRSGARDSVDRGSDSGLNADHEVVQLIQDRVPRLQFERFTVRVVR